jgi:hypothetical protein
MKRDLSLIAVLITSLLSLVVISGLTGAQTKSSDFDGNGKVDFDDFFLFADAFGSRTPADLSRFDLSNNGVVDIDDFFLFAADFGKAIQRPGTTYIDEPILLKASEPVSPIQVTQGEFIFDLSNDPLVQKGECNDFEVTYQTSSSCDENVWVYNYIKQSWDQIGFVPEPGTGCLAVLATQGHLLSARGLKAQNYWNEKFQMKLKGGSGNPKLRALRINPEYSYIPAPQPPYFLAGLAYDGESLWTTSSFDYKIYNISLSGSILKAFAAPEGHPFGVAFDGQNLWVIAYLPPSPPIRLRMLKLTRKGDLLCQFSVPVDHPAGLTWGADKLWLAGYDGPYEGANLILRGIDPDASCKSGTAVITDSLRFSGASSDTLRPPGGGRVGFAWDGQHFLIGTNKLYKLSPTGVVARYDLSVEWANNIAWDGKTVWVLHSGPKGIRSSDPVFSPFKLR